MKQNIKHNKMKRWGKKGSGEKELKLRKKESR